MCAGGRGPLVCRLAGTEQCARCPTPPKHPKQQDPRPSNLKLKTMYCRALWSNPPVHGARIVSEVVGSEEMFGQWKQEMEMMAGRIKVPLFIGGWG